MKLRARDDLFENSTMSFGDHLEELRTALARSLVGLVIGFFVALPFADEAVKFISTPLERALAKVQLTKTESTLEKEELGLPPEYSDLLRNEKQIPSIVKVDVGEIAKQLRAIGVIPETMGDTSGIGTIQVSSVATSKIARALHDADSKFARPSARAIRDLLSPAELVAVETVCRQRVSASGGQRDQVRAIVQRLIHDTQLYALPTFKDLKSLFPQESQREFIERQIGLQNELTPADKVKLNQFLLSAALDTAELAPQPTMIDIRIWKPVDVSIQSLSVQEPFLITIKAAVVLGLLLASPWVFIQIWNFVAAGLYPTERNYVYTYLPFSLGLFLLGAALAFFFVFDPVLDFLFSFNLMLDVDAVPRMSEWLGFVLFMPIGFGLSFQLPLVMLLLERIGIVTIETFVSKWRVSVLVIFALSMFLTPSDPMSMLLMGIPLTILYFGGILLCKYMPRGRSPLGDGYDPA